MLCDECKRRPATVHFTKVVNQHKTEAHLCEECARKLGDEFLLEPGVTFHHILSGLFEAEPAAGAVGSLPPTQKVRCSSCGLSFADFRRLGHLGCSHCYEQFERQLEPILRRIHGSIHHTGKVPRRAAAHLQRERKLRLLREELDEAVAKEEYERAAELRDLIRRLEQGETAGGEEAAAAQG